MDNAVRGSYFRCALPQVCADTENQVSDNDMKVACDSLVCYANLEAQGNLFTRECLSAKPVIKHRLKVSKTPPSIQARIPKNCNAYVVFPSLETLV